MSEAEGTAPSTGTTGSESVNVLWMTTGLSCEATRCNLEHKYENEPEWRRPGSTLASGYDGGDQATPSSGDARQRW